MFFCCQPSARPVVCALVLYSVSHGVRRPEDVYAQLCRPNQKPSQDSYAPVQPCHDYSYSRDCYIFASSTEAPGYDVETLGNRLKCYATATGLSGKPKKVHAAAFPVIIGEEGRSTFNFEAKVDRNDVDKLLKILKNTASPSSTSHTMTLFSA